MNAITKESFKLGQMEQIITTWDRGQCLTLIQAVAQSALDDFFLWPCETSKIDTVLITFTIEVLMSESFDAIEDTSESMRYMVRSALSDMAGLLAFNHCNHCKTYIRPIMYFGFAAIEMNLKQLHQKAIRALVYAVDLFSGETIGNTQSLYNVEYLVMMVNSINDNPKHRLRAPYLRS